MKRRDFIRVAGLTGLASTVKFAGGDKLMAQSTKKTNEQYDLVAVMNGEPDVMFSNAIESMGGMSRFIKKGQRVVVKPNIGWDRGPEFSANTNPLLIATIVKQCLAAGAKEVLVFDHTCDDWKLCYQNSGIEKAVKDAGGKMVFAHEEKYYRSVNLPQGKRLKSTKIHEAIVDCDAWINVPVLKTHGGAKMTISMKNYMGIVWDRRFFHGNDLQQCIADCCTYAKKPVLNVVDAYRIMTANGPKGKSESDISLAKVLIASTDMVAADTAAVNFFSKNVTEMPLSSVGHIENGQSLGIGTTDLSKGIKMHQIKL